MKKHGAVENHVADYLERFFKPGMARHNPFNAENFPYHTYFSYLTSSFFILLSFSLLLQLFLLAPDRYDAANEKGPP